MEEFLSDDESIRKKAIADLQEKLSTSPNELLPQIPELLTTLDKSSDPFTSLQLSSAVSDLLSANPNQVNPYFDAVLNSVSILSGNELSSDDDLLTGTTVKLLTPLQNSLKLEDYLVKAFPTLIKLMGKKSAVKWSAYSPIAGILLSNPVIAADFTEDLLEVMEDFPQLLMIIPNLYTSRPDAFRTKTEVLMKLYKTNPDQQGSIVRILSDIAQEDANLVIPYISDFIGGLNSPMTSYQTMAMLTSIASSDPMVIYPFIAQIKQGVTIQPATIGEGANVLSLIARVSDEKAQEILPTLFEWLENANQTMQPLVLSEIRNIADMNKSLMDPYISIIKGYTENPQESIRDQANLIVDIYEGRDIHSLAKQIDEQNKKISEIVKSLDDLRDYVDENIDMLKDFIAEVAKKLPIPITFSTEGRIRKTLLLHFVCRTQSDRCLYPEDRAFTSETRIINRWLKIAFSAVKLGKAVILPPSAGDAIKSVKEAYDAYKDKKQEDFLDFIKQPFLTSEEQDSLIEQLREANFFNVFVYDSRDTDWNCIMCRSQ